MPNVRYFQKTGRWLLAGAFAILLADAPHAVAAEPATDGSTPGEPVTMLAAASLTEALSEIGERYRALTGAALRLSFASSSQAARQIEAGAPVDIFASANSFWMDYLVARGDVAAATRVDLLTNRLVAVAPAAADDCRIDFVAGGNLDSCLGASGRGAHGRLAVGDPDHVPAGFYARQALTALGLWPTYENRLARADNVRAALALVARGESALGIVYATDAAIVPGLRVVAVFPAATHDPIVYPFALVEEAKDRQAARRFFDYLSGPAALAVFVRHGFAANPAR